MTGTLSLQLCDVAFDLWLGIKNYDKEIIEREHKFDVTNYRLPPIQRHGKLA